MRDEIGREALSRLLSIEVSGECVGHLAESALMARVRVLALSDGQDSKVRLGVRSRMRIMRV
jgi:hypothetical protein